MILIDKSFCGRQFKVVEPASIGFPKHSASTFDDHEPMFAMLEGIKAGEVFVDVGACFGSYAIPALAMGADVLAFEPGDDGYAILEANVQANGWTSRASLFQCILSDGEPLPAPWVAEIFGHHYPAKTRDTRRFDDVARDCQLDRLDWMKLDVEGLEWHVLQGAKESIARWRPTLLIEDHDGINRGVGCQVSDYPESIRSAERIHAMLAALGYRIDVLPFDVSRKFIVARP